MLRAITRRAVAALLLLPSLAVAPPRGPTPVRVIEVTATDFAFRAPDTVAAGHVRFRLRNAGREMHFMQIVRLTADHSIDALRERVAAKDYLPAWVVPVGGPGVPPPRGTSEVSMDLPPGRYGLLCFIPSADGVSHVMKGMIREMVVVPGPNTRGARPAADVRMTLRDYGFELSAPLRAGRRTIRVENAAAQPHEVGIMRLAEGRTFTDALAWEKSKQGPPPFTTVGGALAIARGETNFVHLDLAPGNYVLFCFVPDATDRRPHVAHGMVREIRVE